MLDWAIILKELYSEAKSNIDWKVYQNSMQDSLLFLRIIIYYEFTD